MCSERHYDVAVIGGGLLGCFAARNLRRWALSVALIEAREDVCTGISRANTAIVYPGYDHKPGTRKAGMTVRANAGMEQLCRELEVPYSRCGSLMLSFGEKADAVLEKKYRQGLENGVPGLRLLSGPEAARMEPALAPGVRSALYAPTAGTVNPWQLGIAAFEHACRNGAEAFLNTGVRALRPTDGGYRIDTGRDSFFCRGVVNCAGLEAARIQELLFPPSVRIAVNAGDYLIVDPAAENLPRHILQYEPEEGGKGIAAVPTVEGSLLVGPSERENTADYAASPEGLSFVYDQMRRILPGIGATAVIRSFAAVRPNPQRSDGSSIGSFVIEHPGAAFWSLIGVKTPGMTCADELGRYVAQRLAEELGAGGNPAFERKRPGIRKAHGLPFEDRAALVREDPDYGEILCACSDVTKAEVLEAIRRGAVTVDGIKRRVSTGMGPCQGSRCQQSLLELLAQARGVGISEIEKDGAGSYIVRETHEKL